MPSGSQRLLYFVLAQAFSENKADMANPETWRIAFDRLYQLDCFDIAKAEVGYDESLREILPEPVVPERKLTIDDLESIDTSTRSGAELAKQIIGDSVFGFDGEARKIFDQFLAHVLRTFGVEITPEAQKQLVVWFQRNNRSFLDHRAYDQAKVNLVKRGILPSTCLTEDEILCGSIENEDTQSWQGKRNLKQEIRAAQRQPESI